MKLSISNPKVRKAVFEAYRKRCFFTGRPLAEEEMVIDHLVPKSRGGTLLGIISIIISIIIRVRVKLNVVLLAQVIYI